MSDISVLEELRRLSQMDSTYLGFSVASMSGVLLSPVGTRGAHNRPKMAIGYLLN